MEVQARLIDHALSLLKPGGRLAVAGPSLVLVYALCGFFGFLVLRALGNGEVLQAVAADED